MKLYAIFLLCLPLVPGNAGAQTLRKLPELLESHDPAWPIIKDMISKAINAVEVLPRDTAKANKVLVNSQFNLDYSMGAVIYYTGGILVDSGWIRILGSGSPKLKRDLPGWNLGKSIGKYGEQKGFYLVGDDAIGGFFALNWGGLDSADQGKVFYLNPSLLEWESTGLPYTAWLQWCFDADLKAVYKGLRWKSWRLDMHYLKGDQAFHFMPPLFTKEGSDIEKDMRTPVDEDQIIQYENAAMKQFQVSGPQ
jgi:hypothetical protein